MFLFLLEINGVVRQVTNCSKIFPVGSLPLIRGKTTILPSDRGTTGPGRGSFEGTHSRNGKRMDQNPFYGYMANVCVRPSLSLRSHGRTDGLTFLAAGAGKSVLWYVGPLIVCLLEAYGVPQFHNHRGDQDHARIRTRITRYVLL